ncbi:CCA tRNA nucleotidyltransferase [Thermoplasma sp. Kam2015]|uniref:CCA tRNA nucleotidyltransferase n=1 Tax=Thermoplasma sp. Kam2015 TaxID=2094122 RepID=UPI000D964BA7|nr:CCA tRNA nucleotidyltransferase [Thermoplasma sp. Kam2015]PYB67587.1 CCA tRNA nucleotidyltransferase [Thermoplasma sp. Kam2015]
MINYQEILSRYRPTSEEESKLKEISADIVAKINYICSLRGLRAEAVIVGSYAKGTNLRDGDLDIFIAFDRDYPEEIVNKEGLRIGHAVLPNGREKYAEHPYVSGEVKGVKIDVVPCYKMHFGDRKISAVDRTLLHTEYVNQHLDDRGRDEVRLLKIFMKSIGVYGAEARTFGFSGYLCELLVIRLGSFDRVIQFFSKAKGRVILDVDERFQDPMVLIDPVDPDRNVASPVSLESLSRMKIASKLYISSQDAQFFQIDYEKKDVAYHDRGTCIMIYSIQKPDLTDDVIYPQVYRFRSVLQKIMEAHEIRVISSEIDVSDRIYVLIETPTCNEDRIHVHTGPPVDTDNAVDFIESWKIRKRSRGPYLVGDRLYVDVFTGERSIEEIVRADIENYSIGKNLDKFKKNIEIMRFKGNSERMPVLDKFFGADVFRRNT